MSKGRKREPLVKFSIAGPNSTKEPGLFAEDDPLRGILKGRDYITPPYNPEILFRLFEGSGSLRPNIDAMVTNVDGLGNMLRPSIDLEEEGVEEYLKGCLENAKDVDARISVGEVEPVSDTASLTILVDALKREMRNEMWRAESFFDHCCPDISFEQLRKQTRLDTEVCGNAYWEVLRDKNNSIVQFERISPTTIRLLPLNKELTRAKMRVRINPISFVDREYSKRFRLFVQIVGDNFTYFKELGDPNIYSSKTGERFNTEEELQAAEGGEDQKPVRPATELIHFKVHSPVSPYGIPRWIGTLTSVLGAQDAEEVNLMYFQNKGIPPMVIKVIGGRLSKSAKEDLESYIANEIKGKKNFHKIMILEAEPSASTGSPMTGMQTSMMRIEIEPLTKFQQDDGQFLNYIDKSTERIAQSFRLPSLLRGDSRVMNRATAQTSLKFAEGQVFKPERMEFDFLMNRKILPALGINYYTFVSNGPDYTEPTELVVMLLKLGQAGILTPLELRELSEKIFGKPFKKVKEDWAKRPMLLSQYGVMAKTADVDGNNLMEDVLEIEQDKASAGNQDSGSSESDGSGEEDGGQPSDDVITKALTELEAAILSGDHERYEALMDEAAGFSELENVYR